METNIIINFPLSSISGRNFSELDVTALSRHNQKEGTSFKIIKIFSSKFYYKHRYTFTRKEGALNFMYGSHKTYLNSFTFSPRMRRIQEEMCRQKGKIVSKNISAAAILFHLCGITYLPKDTHI